MARAIVIALVLVSLAHTTAAFGQSEDTTQPWRLHDALGLPDWLRLSISQRARYESLSDEFRVENAGSSNQIWALRTLVAAEARSETWRLGGEMMDARAYGSPDDARLSTSIVDAVELLQAYAGWRMEGVASQDDVIDLQLGRQTMDVGSRRLVARNRFRNTINAFTGLDAKCTSEAETTLRAFYVLPVRRLPTSQSELEDNEIEFDEELEKTRFAGLHLATSFFEETIRGEAYGFHLDEDDESDVVTANRRLWTVGARVLKKPEAGELDFEWESAYQFGDSQISPGEGQDLDHQAQFHHLSGGYLFFGGMQFHLEALFDYASGDRDPNDGDNERFDTLYGARRFEYGPTGIFGAFERSNIMSPGLRLSFDPTAKTNVMLAHRLHYLASKQDAWTTSGLVDPEGDSGRYIGQLAELRVRYDLLPGNLQIEAGVAQLFAGSFIEDAPNATEQGDALYGYVATTLTF